MTLPSLSNLEEIYSKLLKIVAREINNIEELDELDGQTAKKMEIYDKITRASLEYFSNKKPENEYTKLSDEDLLKELENETGN